MADAPKSAFEIAMERLKKKDADAGVEETPLTDDQRVAIAEARSIYDARVAEARIKHQSELTQTMDPALMEKLQQEFRRDLERLEHDRDAKIKKIRAGTS